MDGGAGLVYLVRLPYSAFSGVMIQPWQGGRGLTWCVSGRLYRRAATVVSLRGWRHGACVHSDRGEVQVLGEEVVDVDELH